MSPNPLLAIAIPTYNRSAILRENLLKMLPELRIHQVSVFISDDSTDDLTEAMSIVLRQEFPLIHYRRNQPRYGHDANFFATVAIPSADYVWYLGDSVYFQNGALAAVLQALTENRPDFCFVNGYVSNQVTCLLEGDAVKPFLLDRTWYLTLTGATIYSAAMRALPIAPDRARQWNNFPQLGLTLEACSRAPRRLLWLAPMFLTFNHKKSSYWLHSALKVFVGDWCALIRSFPSFFSEQEQRYVIRSHGKNTGLFNLRSLLLLRAIGALQPARLAEHAADFALASPIAPIWASWVSRFPRLPLQAYRILLVMLRSVHKR